MNSKILFSIAFILTILQLASCKIEKVKREPNIIFTENNIQYLNTSIEFFGTYTIELPSSITENVIDGLKLYVIDGLKVYHLYQPNLGLNEVYTTISNSKLQIEDNEVFFIDENFYFQTKNKNLKTKLRSNKLTEKHLCEVYKNEFKPIFDHFSTMLRRSSNQYFTESLIQKQLCQMFFIYSLQINTYKKIDRYEFDRLKKHIPDNFQNYLEKLEHFTNNLQINDFKFILENTLELVLDPHFSRISSRNLIRDKFLVDIFMNIENYMIKYPKSNILKKISTNQIKTFKQIHINRIGRMFNSFWTTDNLFDLTVIPGNDLNTFNIISIVPSNPKECIPDEITDCIDNNYSKSSEKHDTYIIPIYSKNTTISVIVPNYCRELEDSCKTIYMYSTQNDFTVQHQAQNCRTKINNDSCFAHKIFNPINCIPSKNQNCLANSNPIIKNDMYEFTIPIKLSLSEENEYYTIIYYYQNKDCSKMIYKYIVEDEFTKKHQENNCKSPINNNLECDALKDNCIFQ